MIPRAYIFEWQQSAPWQNNAQVEQDLIIERALIELFSNDMIRENLAFRGGTALHKIFLKPQARYSEDIDLVQINPGPIKPVMQEILKALSFLGTKRKTKQNLRMNTMYYKFESEIPPVIPSRLKIEINCREHGAFFGLNTVAHQIKSSWFTGNAEINSYHIEELLGTKMRALYQRNKGRDLFDLWYAITNLNPDCDKVVYCFKKYMEKFNEQKLPQAEFLDNLDKKMLEADFLGDTKGLLRPQINYNPGFAYNIVKTNLIDKI